MAAVIRVKRQLVEEPSDAIILNCKRRKLNANSDDNTELSRAVLKFAGTIQKDENILDHIEKQNKSVLDSLKENFKKRDVNLTDKLREQTKINTKKSRYRIVNCFRTPNPEVQEESSKTETSGITILEVEHDTKQSETSSEENDEQDYVYDLYYTNSDDFGDGDVAEYVSIEQVDNTLVFGSFRDNGVSAQDSDASEDSNDENNWRNDYPEESDHDSINQDDIIYAMENVAIDEDLLSSDEGEEGFVYSIDSEAAGFEEDIDESDVHRYGEQYARFKARNRAVVTTQLTPQPYYSEVHDDHDYYY